MPRNRFQWDAVPQPLLRRLARELALPGDAVGALAKVYGKRPGASFVRDNWPVLRDAWLGMDTPTRRGVVDRLRGLGLGDMKLPVRTKAQQQTYLASCRNSSSLRQVVLEAFHALGAAEGTTDPWEAAVIDAWGEFAVQLEATLRALPEDVLVELTLPERLAGGQGVRPELWFRGRKGGALEGGVMAEFDVMELSDLLDPAQISMLGELGWELTWAASGGRSELELALLTGGRADAERLALAAVATMRQVFGTVHPSFVVPGGFCPQGGAGSTGEPAIVHEVGGADGLNALVDAALAPVVGGDVWRDEDGDIPVDMGGPICYVRVQPDSAFVTLFCPLLYGVEGSALVLERLNELNKRYRSSCLTWDAGVVTATIDLCCSPFVPELLRESLGGIRAVAHEIRRTHRLLGGDRHGA